MNALPRLIKFFFFFRVGSCRVFNANTFFSPHQQSVLQSTTFRPDLVETSCFATLTAGVVRKMYFCFLSFFCTSSSNNFSFAFLALKVASQAFT